MHIIMHELFHHIVPLPELEPFKDMCRDIMARMDNAALTEMYRNYKDYSGSIVTCSPLSAICGELDGFMPKVPAAVQEDCDGMETC